MMRNMGKAEAAMKPMSRPVIPCSTNRLKPMGGVICAISTTIIR